MNHNDALQVKLSEFVKDVCKGRDPSHGWEHTKTVAKNAMIIFNGMYDDDNFSISDSVIAVAWLHDVVDYDGKLRKKCYTFLVQELKCNDQVANQLLNIIDRVSFSREQDYGDSDWLSVIGTDGITVRNIVSDANKLEAIYDGLYRLVTIRNYIRTKLGKEMAVPLHNKVMGGICVLESNIQPISKYKYATIGATIGFMVGVVVYRYYKR
jgi:hypothetical protein